MNIPDEAIDAAARSLFSIGVFDGDPKPPDFYWHRADEEVRVQYRRNAARALGAAAPLIAAQVLREAPRLNGPMVQKLRRCAADTSPDWAGAVTVYPPETRGLVALIDWLAAQRRERSELPKSSKPDIDGGRSLTEDAPHGD